MAAIFSFGVHSPFPLIPHFLQSLSYSTIQEQPCPLLRDESERASNYQSHYPLSRHLVNVFNGPMSFKLTHAAQS
ncbi:hypothetical protein K469DRAFT_718921 [Zopfia rhizophila CBS 207.26]|uniref:Uncharacterized protein n=1 Tax=Zopfia rhizophila CBS 207.26 TaxID=1314779 RepID=A0A6A6EJM2_9PEZI|nr:hypothetical protein K469DRAFT_718921 [Zopfia rhizophila CBS 207.26]